jgi:hypothetical protein
VTLRRGSQILVEMPFGPGHEPVMGELANALQTTAAGRRGDEWLVVESADSSDPRRWCKLPKLGVVATWGKNDRLLLTSRMCFVDIAQWTVTFVMRGSRKIGNGGVPRNLTISILDLTEEKPADGAISTNIAGLMPREAHAGHRAFITEDETTTGLVPPNSTTRILSPEERARALASFRDDETVTGAGRRRSSSGLRLGRMWETPRPPESGAGASGAPASGGSPASAPTIEDPPQSLGSSPSGASQVEDPDSISAVFDALAVPNREPDPADEVTNPGKSRSSDPARDRSR